MNNLSLKFDALISALGTLKSVLGIIGVLGIVGLIIFCILLTLECSNYDSKIPSICTLIVSILLISIGFISSPLNVEKENEIIVPEINEELQENNIEDTIQNTPEKRDSCDLRNSKWGDDIETVKFYEHDLDFREETENSLLADVEVRQYDSYVQYFFENDILYGGAYIIDPQGMLSNGQYVDAYDILKLELTEKYGSPRSDQLTYLDNADVIDILGLPSALAGGLIKYQTVWVTDTSLIGMSMEAQNFSINLIIIYSDINYVGDFDYGL